MRFFKKSLYYVCCLKYVWLCWSTNLRSRKQNAIFLECNKVYARFLFSKNLSKYVQYAFIKNKSILWKKTKVSVCLTIGYIITYKITLYNTFCFYHAFKKIEKLYDNLKIDTTMFNNTRFFICRIVPFYRT